MSFPYRLKKKIYFEDSDYWIQDLPTNFHTLFIEALKNNYDYQEEQFLSKHSLFNISFKFDVESELNDKRLIVTYHLHLHNLVNVIIAILLLSTFLSKFSFGAFLWSSFLISIAFYKLSLLIIHSGIKKQIYRILSAYKKVKDESDIEYWVKENGRNCPACGASLDNQTLFCKDCGLKIRQNAYTKPLDISADTLKPNEDKKEDKATSIHYHYKK